MQKKRLISLVLVLTMLISMMPLPSGVARAEEFDLTYDKLKEAINTFVEKVKELEDFERTLVINTLKEMVQEPDKDGDGVDDGITDLQNIILSLNSDNPDYIFGKDLSIRFVNAITARSITVEQAAKAVKLIGIWEIEDRVKLVESLDSDQPIQFFATTEEELQLIADIRASLPDFEDLLAEQEISIDEFSFFAFAAQRAIGGPIFEDEGEDSLRLIRDDRFERIKTILDDALDGLVIKGREFVSRERANGLSVEPTVDKLFSTFENRLQNFIAQNGPEQSQSRKDAAKAIFIKYDLYQQDNVTIKIVPVYDIINENEVVAMDVVLRNGENMDISALDVTIKYDNGLLLKSAENNISLSNTYMDTTVAGSIKLGFDLEDGQSWRPESNEVIATLHFSGKNVGMSNVDFLEIKITKSNGEEIVADFVGAIIEVRGIDTKSPALTLVPRVERVEQQQTILVDLYLENTQDLEINSLQTSVEFGENLSFVSVKYEVDTEIQTISEEEGKVVYVFTLPNGGKLEPSARILVATFELKAIVPGTASITLGETIILNPQGNDITDYLLVGASLEVLQQGYYDLLQKAIEDAIAAIDALTDDITVAVREEVEAARDLVEAALDLGAEASDITNLAKLVAAETLLLDTDAPQVVEGSSAISKAIAKGGDEVTISFTADENIREGYLNIGYIAKDIPLVVTGKSASATYTVPNGINLRNVPLTVVIYDQVKNKGEASLPITLTIDNKAPSVFLYEDSTVEYGFNNYVVSNTLKLNIVTDGVSIEWKMGDGEYTSVDANNTQINVDSKYADGLEHTVYYRAKDQAGNVASGEYKFVWKNEAPVAPTVELEGPVLTNQTTYTIAGTTSESTVIIKRVVDANTEETVRIANSFPINVNLRVGENKFVAYIMNDAGLMSTGTEIPVITRDSVKPQIAVEQLENGQIKISANKDVENISYSINGGEAVEVEGTIVKDGSITIGVELANGSNRIVVTAYDKAGNEGKGRLTVFENLQEVTEETVVTEELSIKSGKFTQGNLEVRTVTVAPATNKNLVSEAIKFSGVEVEEDVKITLQLAKGLPAETKLYYFDEGNNGWIVLDGTNEHGDSSYDPETGIMEATLKHFSVYAAMAEIDTEAPVISNIRPADGFVIAYDTNIIENGKIVVSGMTNEEANVTINGIDAAKDENNGFGAFIDVEQGTQYITIVATDLAGNIAETIVTIFVDTVRPTITINGIADGAKVSTDVNVAISLSEKGSWTAILKQNEVEVDTFTAPFTLDAGSYNGEYTLEVTATDLVGNRTFKTIEFTIDNRLPEISEVVKTETSFLSNGAFTNEDVTVTISTDEDVDLEIRVTKDGQPFDFNNGDTITADGSYRIVATATKTLGEDTLEAVSIIEFTIDKTNPVISITGVSHNGSYTAPVTPVITVTDANLESVTITLNDEAFVSGTTISEKKEHTLVVTAIDKAGNPSKVVYKFTIREGSGGIIIPPGPGPGPIPGPTPQPEPEVENKETAKVGTKATEVKAFEGAVILNFEAGTFSKDVEVSVEVLEESEVTLPKATKTTKLTLASKIYEFDASGAKFNKPVTVTFEYNNEVVKDARKLGVYLFNEETETWDFVGGKADVEKSTITVTLKHFSKYTVMYHEKTFVDILGNWAKADIELMASLHLLKGINETSYAPSNDMTRAEFVTLLARVLGLELVEGVSSFEDVDANIWYAPYVEAAYKAGVINGVSETKFAPTDKITREQMATIIMRAYNQLTNSDYTERATSDEVRFADEAQIALYAYKAVMVANDLGIITGVTKTTFVPKANATRAEAAVMIKRLLEAIGRI